MAPHGHPLQPPEPTVFLSKACAARSAPRFPEFISRLRTSHLPFGHFEPLLCVTREAAACQATTYPPWIPHEGNEQGEGDRPGGGREREHRGEAERIGQKPRGERRAERHGRHQRGAEAHVRRPDRKSTRLNSSHRCISY